MQKFVGIIPKQKMYRSLKHYYLMMTLNTDNTQSQSVFLENVWSLIQSDHTATAKWQMHI